MSDALESVVIGPPGNEDSTEEPARSRGGWWGQYLKSLEEGGVLSRQAIEEIERVSWSVGDRLPNPGKKNGERVVGAVVGAVQSGKTGVLAGIAAIGLSLGYRVVIVLAGQKDDLRMQTARRIKRDLLCRGDRLHRWENGAWTASDPPKYDHPKGKGAHGPMTRCWAPHYKDDINKDDSFGSQLLLRAIQGDPVLLVVKKNAKVLEKLHGGLARAQAVCGPENLPIMILDDECDEASVGDPKTESPTSESIKSLLMTAENQVVAYVGVTATIAANILLDPDDELFPRDFIEVTRYADAAGTALTFEEPDPLNRYSGGFTFYRMLEEHGESNFLIQDTISEEERDGIYGTDTALEEALVAYLVSGAMRLATFKTKSPPKPGDHPPPHCMMLHTESRKADHWSLAREVVDLVCLKAGCAPACSPLPLETHDPSKRIDPGHLADWLASEPDRWKEWYERFYQSRGVMQAILPGISQEALPSWDETRAVLGGVFSQVKLRVINSDDWSKDPPLDFGFRGGERPYDNLSIIIGGDRLSRGLTVEGLCVSYYTRHSRGVLAEDTAVQRERWFGYRGKHLEYCRVFLNHSAAREYSRFYEHETDLRRQFAWILKERETPRESAFRLLCLPTSRPTAKARRGHHLSLSLSGTNLFLNRVQMGEGPELETLAEGNQDLAADWWSRISGSGTERKSPTGETLGWILAGVSTDEVIGLLEGLRFNFHNPDPSRHVSVALRETHRQPEPGITPSSSLGMDSCPYLAAAYLRFWSQGFQNRGEGPTGRLRGPTGISDWSPIRPPTFNVGFRFGAMPVVDHDPFAGARLLNRTVYEDGFVAARWGGHGVSSGYHGDEWFDIDPPLGDPTARRGPHSPGLVLIQVAHKDAEGKTGRGVQYRIHRPFLGICLPEGGPSFDAVVATPG